MADLAREGEEVQVALEWLPGGCLLLVLQVLQHMDPEVPPVLDIGNGERAVRLDAAVPDLSRARARRGVGCEAAAAAAALRPRTTTDGAPTLLMM